MNIGYNSLSKVQSANLSNLGLNTFNITNSSFIGLSSLNLNNNNFTSFNIPNSSLEKVTTLNLDNNRLTSFDNTYFSNSLNRLGTLTLNGNAITTATFQNLNSLQRLEITNNYKNIPYADGSVNAGTLQTFNWNFNSLVNLNYLTLENSVYCTPSTLRKFWDLGINFNYNLFGDRTARNGIPFNRTLTYINFRNSNTVYFDEQRIFVYITGTYPLTTKSLFEAFEDWFLSASTILWDLYEY
ncbi:MAG: leucine-rich repeat domain-containing protein [Sediminibacterium sp.]|nr:leucine-rich repeat domain-containing protein [Sediminibacterium sp.]